MRIWTYTPSFNFNMFSISAATVAITALLVILGAYMTVFFNNQHRPRPTLKPQSSDANATKRPLPRPKTIRISRIPKSVSREQIHTWLDSLETSIAPLESKNILHLSIVPESLESSQATVTFLCPPKLFQNLGQRTLRCDGPDNYRLTADTHFLGSTVLYDPLQVKAEPTVAE